jgi:hypothetical protein
MIARNSNSHPPPTTMLAQTMVIGPQTNIVNGEGGKLGIFWKVYELISMIVYWHATRSGAAVYYRFLTLRRHCLLLRLHFEIWRCSVLRFIYRKIVIWQIFALSVEKSFVFGRTPASICSLCVKTAFSPGFQMAFCLCLGFSIKIINSPIFKFSSTPL